MKSYSRLFAILVSTLLMASCAEESPDEINSASETLNDAVTASEIGVDDNNLENTTENGLPIEETPLSTEETTSSTEENTPPTITGNPDTSIAEGDTYSFTPTASDVDGDTLNFSINYTPNWASFNSTNGNLSGTPDFDDAGSYDDITISVRDSTTETSLPAFSITVTDTNRTPSIDGTPEDHIYVGESYSFQPTVSDPDSDNQLTFNAEQLPGWASCNPETGAISGTPGPEDTGLYEDITITVSDGYTESALTPFSIMVDNIPVLSWTIPTTRTDGSSLDEGEIGGYMIYVYKEEGEFVLTEVIDHNVSNSTSYDLSALQPGTYKFKMSTYDMEHIEGPLSNESNSKEIM